jgi:hypothetical protein
LEVNWRPELLFVLQQEVEMYGTYQQRIAECDQQLQKHLASLVGTVPPPSSQEKPEKKKTKQAKNAPRFELGRELQRITGVDLTLSKPVEDNINFFSGPAQHTAKGAHDPAHQSDDDYHKCQGDHCRPIWMPGGKPCEKYSQRVLPDAQCRFGKRFRIRSHGCADSGLAAVRCQCNCASQKRGQ